MTFYWFGDSWVFGDELELQVDQTQQHLHTFAHKVSEHFGAKCVNLSQCGSSVMSLPLQFKNTVKNINPDSDRVFFFLTASHRTSLFDDQGQIKNILPMGYTIKHNIHKHCDQWYKYFDNSFQRLYNYDSTISLLYLWCRSLAIRCYFSNIFTVEKDTLIDCSDEFAWLLPKTQCISQWILPVVDPENGSPITDDHPGLTTQQWQQQQPWIEKYIKPCYAHPNIEGHSRIAKNIIEILENE